MHAQRTTAIPLAYRGVSSPISTSVRSSSSMTAMPLSQIDAQTRIKELELGLENANRRLHELMQAHERQRLRLWWKTRRTRQKENRRKRKEQLLNVAPAPSSSVMQEPQISIDQVASAPRAVYPFISIVGQEEMKLALILNVIDPRIGGVMVMGDR
jgi:hypothetical protein